MGDTTTCLKCQLKTAMLGWGRQLWEVTWKTQRTRVQCCACMSFSSALIRVSRDMGIRFSQMFKGDILTNGAFPYKYGCLLRRKTSTWFSELLPCLLFLAINQPKIIVMLNRCILGWPILFQHSSQATNLHTGYCTNTAGTMVFGGCAVVQRHDNYDVIKQQ